MFVSAWKYFFSSILMALVFTTAVTGQSPPLTPDTTSVTFRIRNAGFWVDGSFDQLELRGVFDPAQPTGSKIIATIPVSTLVTGIDKRDEHLMEASYFDVQAFPDMELSSDRIVEKGEGFVLEGMLTIKGVEKAVSLSFARQRSGDQWILESTFELNRRDFGVGGNSWILSDTVEVTIWMKWPAR